ncbi:hypothetical protein SAMN02745217_01374 [Anaerocolumna xylanovorans DSM 12503]|uniref:SAF domain-containing protein n=2 Tax=Anaerocolumna TaxID=1843210 RepID=A0A1M7Y447_9FIRM|nr:hypothetical protein SAMN02745217_01374 [Anaerocolumna xylanovorans DSM 12503]
MSKRLKRPLSKKQMAKRILTVSLCILLPFGLYIGYVKVKGFYEERMEAMAEEMSGYTVTAYEAVTDIKAGEIITKEMAASKRTLSGQDKKNFMTADDIGSQALADIPKGTELLKNMLLKNTIEDDLRELEFSSNIAGEHIREGDYTDIRLRYPDGEDYIVLSKIYINRIDLEKRYLYLNLSPEEIHLISSALVDCYLKTGSYLYMARYIQASCQEPSYVTYIPNTDVLELMKKDPNIAEKTRDYFNETGRRELEERLKTYYGQYGSGQSDPYSVNTPLYYPNGTGTEKKTSALTQNTDTAGNTVKVSADSGKEEGMEEKSEVKMEVDYAE